LKVRGITVLTRKNIVIRRFGGDAWTHLYRDVSAGHPCFRSFITPDSLVPLTAYLALHDELVRRLYADDDVSNVELGRESARWALTEGPCKAVMERGDLSGFVASLPRLWNLYFADTTSRAEASINGDAVEFKVFDLPQWHPYLEHFIMGFNAEVLESFCANPIGIARLRGGHKHYRYLLQASSDRPPSQPVEGDAQELVRERRRQTAARHLSDREIDVLLLVADGKTNEEIGMVLGISGKTVQHHLARIYRKIDVTSRVTAALWLAERGLAADRVPVS
jgi:DNA-binding CsgD family transcriptional regulator